MKYGLSDQQRKEITDILTSYKAVEKAILFGSRAIDTYKEASDVDIAIKGQNADWSLAMTIQDHLEEETYLPFFFDVVAYGSVESEELRRHIDGKGKVLFCRGVSEGLMENGELSVENGGSAWQEAVLSEIIDLIGGGTPKTKIKEYWDGNIPWLSVVDFNTGNKFVFDTEKKITQDGLENSSTKLLEEGDIIISARGTVGVVAILGKKMAFNQSCYGIKAIDGKSTNNYVYYLLKDAVLNFIQIAHGGVFDTITRDTFDEIDISLPPLPEQKAIADVLSALDDKIDLLHCQNKTLEQMAETLFRQWFVVEAGEDWVEYKVSDIVNHIKENVKPGSNPLLTYRHYSLPAFDNEKNPVIEVGKDILSNKYVVLPQTILVSKLNPKVPRIWAIPDKVAENSVCSTEFQVFQPKKELYYGFLCFLFKSNEAVGELEMAASGTSGSHQRVKSQDILNIMFSVPSLDKIEKYSQEVKPLIEKQQRNNDYICTLQSLRDTLLPKLMSGEVRIASNG